MTDEPAYPYSLDYDHEAAEKIRNEVTSEEVARIAARGLKIPKNLTAKEIRSVCASVLTQRPDKPPPAEDEALPGMLR